MPNTGKADEYDKAVKALSDYFTPQKNTDNEVYLFRQATQKEDESVDVYYTRLKHLASTCEFPDIDKEIKAHIVQTCRSARLRRTALRKPLTLQELLSTARAMELAEFQASGIKGDKETLSSNHTVSQVKSSSKPRAQNKPPVTQNQCYFCGGTYPHPGGRPFCPAHDKTCNNCGKLGHLASMYRSSSKSKKFSSGSQRFRKPKEYKSNSQKVNQVESTTSASTKSDISSSEEYVLTVENTESSASRAPQAQIKLCGTSIRIMIDTGATVNILDGSTYDKLKQKPSSNLASFYQDKINALKQERAELQNKGYFITDDLSKVDLHEKKKMEPSSSSAV